jgi:hypothetical protein
MKKILLLILPIIAWTIAISGYYFEINEPMWLHISFFILHKISICFLGVLVGLGMAYLIHKHEG